MFVILRAQYPHGHTHVDSPGLVILQSSIMINVLCTAFLNASHSGSLTCKCLPLFLWKNQYWPRGFKVRLHVVHGSSRAEVSRGGQRGGSCRAAILPVGALRLCLCLWRLFGGCRSHRTWTRRPAIAVAPGTMQQSTHLTMSVQQQLAGVWSSSAFKEGEPKEGH